MDPSAAEPPLEDAAPLTVGSFVEVRDKTDEPWRLGRVTAIQGEGFYEEILVATEDLLDNGYAWDEMRPASDAAVRALDPASGLALAPLVTNENNIVDTMDEDLDAAAAADAAAGPALPPKLLRLTVSHNLIRNFGQEAGVDPFAAFCSPPAAGLLERVEGRTLNGACVWRGGAATAYDKTDRGKVVWLYRDDNTPKAQWRVTVGQAPTDPPSGAAAWEWDRAWPSALLEGRGLFVEVDRAATRPLADPRDVGEGGWETYEKFFKKGVHRVTLLDASGPDGGWPRVKAAEDLAKAAEETEKGEMGKLEAAIAAGAEVDSKHVVSELSELE